MTLEEAIGRYSDESARSSTHTVWMEWEGERRKVIFYMARRRSGEEPRWRLAMWVPAKPPHHPAPHPHGVLETASGAGDWKYFVGQRNYDEIEVRMMLAGCEFDHPYPQE